MAAPRVSCLHICICLRHTKYTWRVLWHIKIIHRPSCDVIMTSFSMVIRKKTITQGCKASIKQCKFGLLIAFWVGNKEQYVLVVFWRKLRFKRWLLISKSQHILYVSSALLHEIYWCHRDVTRWSHDLHFYPYFIFSVRLLQKPIVTVIGQTNKRWHNFPPQTTLVTRVGKKSFYTHFAPPHPCAMLTKHFHLTQVCILPFPNIERGSGGVDTYSVGITIIISCFWHFPTQFFQGCLSFHML